MRVLGIDYGARRIGLALGDTESRIASPWSVLKYEELSDALQKINDVIEKEGAKKVVVGVPYPLMGISIENEQVKEVRLFIDELREMGLLVEEMDERLSSQIAIRYMHERGERGKRDDLAATAILQTWLDKQ
ncbi:MAG: Holliday junction resolvase RuvX [Patescibacteria group bacterium]|nr:Holliday junction resolvase RuvX [Patescibacteria group bacterium]MBU2509503.1 Holliday junction resolvase RuvX [Patescibacteria group bacterium]